MKKRLLSFILLLFAGITAAYADWDFSAVAPTGQTLYYTITSSGSSPEVWVTYPGEDSWKGYTKPTDSLTIPSTVTYGGVIYSVTSIGYDAFTGCSSLTSVTIPNSVTSIGEYAFSGCSNLTSVTIPNSVTSIGIYAFRICRSLTSVTIPNSVISIGHGVFAYCSGLTSIIVSSGNTVYDSRSNCNAIIRTANNVLVAGCQNTTIPNSVISIGYGAFEYCSSLTSATIPNSVIYICEGAFRGCSSLTSVTIPNSVRFIATEAFRDCSCLTSVNIPDSVTSIGNNPFSECSGLTSVTVSSGNTVYDSRDNCNAIIHTSTNTLVTGCQNTTIPNSVTSIGSYAFYYCSSLTSVTIPSSVTSIGDYAFRSCSSLTSVTIPNSVTTIGYSAFWSCSSLTSVTIPNSVTTIENSAFRSCSSLTSVTAKPTVAPSSDWSAFYNVPSNIPVYIPCGSRSSYSSASGWSHFSNFIEVMFDSVHVASADESMGTAAVVTQPNCASPTATIIATPNTGYAFVNWTEDSAVVSTDATYTFSVTADRTLIAHFAPVSTCGIASTDLPYTDNFDSYTTSTTAKTGVEPDCWTLANQYVDMTDEYKPMIYYSSANAHSGSYSLILNKRGIYAMPEYDGDVSTLQLSMYVKQGMAKYQLQVGVMSDLTDASTFVTVATINNSSTAPVLNTVSFANYTGSGHYIAFRNILASGYSGDFSCNYIDDLVLDIRPANTCGISTDDLPYTDNFDSYTNSTTAKTGVEPDCWTLAHLDVAMTDEYKPMIYYASSNSHSGSYSLLLNKRGIYAMPEFDGEISSLQLSMYVKQGQAKYQLQVGVMSNLSDVNTFVPVATINNSTTGYVLNTVSFASYSGNGRFIAFRNVLPSGQTGAFSCNYIDDITLEVRPSGCAAITTADLPYIENFDTHTSSTIAKTGVEPDCWTLAHQYVVMADEYKPMIYYASANSHSGRYSLLLNKRGIYAMPEFEGDVSTLQLSMYVKQGQAKYQLQVGVMSDLSNESSFVPVATINNGSTTPELKTVDFSSYTGSGHYIAFRNVLAPGYTGDYSCNYIDDINLSVAPATTNYTIIAIPTAGGTVSGAGTYASGSSCTLRAIPASGYTFANWTSGVTVVSTNATYTFTVTSNRTLTANFSPVSACGISVADLPYTDNFDSYTNSTTAKTGVEPTCWALVHQDVMMSDEYKPMVYYNPANARSGSYSLLLNKRGIYAMPAFEGNVNTLWLMFSVKQNALKYQLQVGVMTNPTDASTFLPYVTIDNTSNTAYENYIVSFVGYSDTGHYIAFRNILAPGYTGDFSCNYIDDLTLCVAGDASKSAEYVDVTPRQHHLNIYPNPTTGVVNVAADEEVQRVEVYDRTGRRVTTFERQSTIDLSRFATGIYTFRVILPERIEVRRVVKQ